MQKSSDLYFDILPSRLDLVNWFALARKCFGQHPSVRCNGLTYFRFDRLKTHRACQTARRKQYGVHSGSAPRTHPSKHAGRSAGQSYGNGCDAGDRRAADHFYVIPPGTCMSVAVGGPNPSQPRIRYGSYLPFDFLPQALIAAQGPHAARGSDRILKKLISTACRAARSPPGAWILFEPRSKSPAPCCG